MKFMKLGSKPDAFQAEGNSIRFVSSDLATDIIINVGDVQFLLHKFPLLSKSNYLQKLVSRDSGEDSNEIELANFPGGPKAFEICAKFCYGMTVTLNPYNVVAARCAAEYLEMTEDVDRGNLIFKIEVFLNSSVFRSWKDSIIVLQTTKSLLPWSENLKVIGRCIDSIASKTSVDPSNITWSYTYNRKLSELGKRDYGSKLPEKMDSVPRDWWVEDICELDIDIYERLMVAVKSKGRMDGRVIGEALKAYAVRWLPDSIDALASEVHGRRNKIFVETLIRLLPSDKGISCSSCLLLKVLKVAVLVGVDHSSREDLIGCISLKLDEASVTDLLIPARPPQSTRYDVELVKCLIHGFIRRVGGTEDVNDIKKNLKSTPDLVLGRGSWLNVGKLIDGYLAEIASDPDLTLSCFIELAQLIPDSARPIHDGLYAAIDIFLKEHPTLPKAERKKLCGLMDVRKLTMDASMHAAQNEWLPLRTVVQVLFFEQVKVAAGLQAISNDASDTVESPTNIEEDWGKAIPPSKKTAGKQIDQLQKKDNLLKEKDDDPPKDLKLMKKGSKNRGSGAQLLPSRSRRIFDKLWSGVKGNGNSENKSSDTSGSSQSPTSMVPGMTKSSSSRHRRHSIS